MCPTTSDWERFFTRWDDALTPRDQATDNEGAVESFAHELLGLLGWEEANLAWKETLTVQCGSETRTVLPDVVVASTKADTKVPGKVFAVVELRKRGLANENARAQAQSYADPLHAPVYVVIDGERIKVWHRRIVQADLLELEVTRSEFAQRFDDVATLLGREQLTRLHEILRTRDEVQPARANVGSTDHTVRLTRLALRDGRVWSDRQLAELVTAQTWWGSPAIQGAEPSRCRLELSGQYSDWRLGAPRLVDTLVRLCDHVSTVHLAVSEPEAWSHLFRNLNLHLALHHASEPRAQPHAAQAPNFANVDLGDPAVLGDTLAAKLDEWVVEAVKIGVLESLRSGAWSAVADRLASPLVNMDWLRSTLRTSHGDAAHAIHRFGPKSVTYLVDAVLYSRAVTEVLATLAQRAEPEFPHNLDFGQPGARTGIGFAYALGEVEKLEAEAYLLLLSASSRTSLPRPSRIGDPPRAPDEVVRAAWRIGDQQGNHRILCCLSDDARLLVRQGWHAFEAHLIEQIRRQNALTDSGPNACPIPPSPRFEPPSTSIGPTGPAQSESNP